jgi:hypothetical protein
VIVYLSGCLFVRWSAQAAADPLSLQLQLATLRDRVVPLQCLKPVVTYHSEFGELIRYENSQLCE